MKSVYRHMEEHQKRARESRRLYHMRRNKATKEENVANGYLSMIIDGAGAQASNYCPRYSTSEKSEPARHKMLKIKLTYVKVNKIRFIFTIYDLLPYCFQVHGVGGLVLTSFPGNLIVESIIRGIRFAAKRMNRSNFSNIYVQLDNCNTNKCSTVIVACALLVKLGICRKIKVNFLDIDALIGSVVTKLRPADLRTFEERITAIKNALNHIEEGQVKDVEEVIGISDYEVALANYSPPGITGLMQIKEFRIKANAEGDPVFLYKSNSTIDGWLPKPFDKTEDFKEMEKVFKHPDPMQGKPQHCVKFPGSSDTNAERGQRQSWFYKIRYAGGETKTWCLKCTGIPIKFPAYMSQTVQHIPKQFFEAG